MLAMARGHTFVVTLDTRPLAFDPRVIGGDANSSYLEELRFLRLVNSDQNWKVTIQAGIQFALGRTLTADDVVAT